MVSIIYFFWARLHLSYICRVVIFDISISVVVITVPIRVDVVSDFVVNVEGSHVALETAKERGKIVETEKVRDISRSLAILFLLLLLWLLLLLVLSQ